MANRYWVGGTGTWNTTSTTNWSASSGGASGASVPTTADSVFFDQAGTYTVTMTGALNCNDLTVSAGTVTFATGTTPTLTTNGNWSIIAGTVWNSTGAITINSGSTGVTKTLNTNNITINANITFTGSNTGTCSLASDLTLAVGKGIVISRNTLALNTYTLTCSSVTTDNAATATRILNFGTSGKVVINANTTSTIFSTASTSSTLSISGSAPRLVECIGGGTGVTKTINTVSLGSSDSVSFSLLETTGTVTYAFTASSVIRNLIVNGSQTLSNSTLIIYGDFTHLTTNGTTTFTAGANAWNFNGPSTSTINSVSGFTYDFPWSVNDYASVTLANNLTIGTTRTFTFTNSSLGATSTLSLGSYTLTCGIFVTSGTAGSRAFSFGTGKIVLTRAATATIWDSSSLTGVTVSGTALVECQGGGSAVTKTINAGTGNSDSSVFNFSLLETTGTVTYAFTAASSVKNLLINGLQTVSNTAFNIYGDFTHLTTGGTTTFTAGTNAWTFADSALMSTHSRTITPSSGFTYNFPWTFNGISTTTWTLAGNLTLTNTRTATLTAGTLALSTYTFTCGIFSSNNTNTRSIDFGTGKIVLNGTATATVWDFTDVTGLTVSGTPLVECTGAGTTVTKTIITGTRVGAGTYNSATAVSFSLLSPSGTSTYSFSSGNATAGLTRPYILNLICNGVQTLTMSNGLGIRGSFTHSTVGGTTTFSTTGTPAFVFSTLSSTSVTITPASVTYAFPWTISPATTSTVTLAANLTTSNTVTLSSGTFSLSSFTLTVKSFVTGDVNVITRTLDFGTGKIVLSTNATGTVWDATYSSSANFTITGSSRTVECIGGGAAVTKTFINGSPSIDVSFLETTGSATYSLTTSSGGAIAFRNLTCNGVQTLSFSSGININNGTFTHSNTNGTTTFSGTTIGFYATTGTYTINSLAGYSYPFGMEFGNSSTAGTYALSKNLTVTDVRLAGGTLSLGTYTLSISGTFDSSTVSSPITAARTLDFGTGKIVLNGNTTQTIWTITTSTNLTIAGTSLVECSGGGTTVTKTIDNSGIVEANAVNFSLLETTGSVTYALTGPVDNLIVNGLQTVGSGSTINLYGNYTYNNTNGTSTFGSNIGFIGSSGTQTITTNGLAQTSWFNVNTTGSTVQLAGNLTFSSANTYQLFLTKGAFDFNNKTLTVGTGNIQVQAATNTVTVSNTGGTSAAITNAPINHQTGTLSLGSNITTTGAYSFATSTGNPSTLSLNTYTLSVLTFASNTTSTTRTIAFGTGQLAISGNSATILNLTNLGTLSYTGTFYINCTYTGSTGTRSISLSSAATEAQSANFNISTSGTSGIVLSPAATDTISCSAVLNNLDLTGFTGTLANAALKIYGNVTLPASGGTFTSGTSAWTFASTSGTKTITSNGRTLDWPFTFNGVGGTWSLSDALTLGSNGTVTQTNGTLDLNGKTLTTSGQYLTAAGTKNLTFNTGTLLILRGTAGFNNAAPTGYTTTAGSGGEGEINMGATGGVAKSFTGGGSTYNCALNNSTSGQLSITGSNTFSTILNSTQPTTFQFGSGSTTTVTNWAVSGTSGNLVTIRSSTNGSAHTLSKSTGTVTSDYLSIRDSTATGGAVWYAGANSVNVSNNTGWIFSGPGPGTESGTFLLMFN